MNYKFEEYLSSFLFELDGKITKAQFKEIVKFYNWKFKFKSIHIVGTNGKGSNAKYLNDELIEQKYRVGLFTSPHIFSMYERIKINNQNIDFETLVKYTSDFKNDFPKFNFGFFDLFFLSALRYFYERDVDVAIFEAGIGAKKDIVNYLDHQICLITSIGLDHEKLLGNTVEKIAYDKSFAIKKNNCYISNLIDKKIIDILIKDKKLANIEIVNVDNTTFETANISLAKYILKKEFNIDKFKSLFLLPLGRAQKIKLNNFDCYLDVAHNLEGITASLKYYDSHNIHFDQVVVSLSSDKDEKGIIELIKTKYNHIFVYVNKSKKALKTYQCDINIPRIISLEGFVKKINCQTLFIGSFYFISEILVGVNFENINPEDNWTKKNKIFF